MRWWALGIGAFLVATIPIVQYFFGLVFFFGEACLGSLFLLGFALAIFTGERWEELKKGQAVDGLFLAIALAAICSLGLQLCQWLELDILGIWLIPSGPVRPSANFAQPNNLGTFFLWGIVACAWANFRGILGPRLAMLLAGLQVFGIALTQSRTAAVGMFLVAILLFTCRKIDGARRLFHASLVLLALLVFCLMLLPIISDALFLVPHENRLASANSLLRDDVRMILLRLFLNASLDRPWFGYGWANVGEAFFSSVNTVSTLGSVFYHSHNIFIDWVLWVGWPLGLLLAVALLAWLINTFRALKAVDELLLLAFLGVVGWHAMLELPLHYASFLLPSGLVMGVLNAKTRSGEMFRTRLWPVVVIFCATLVTLLAVGWDYFRVQENVISLRFERLNIKGKQAPKTPEVFVLTQLAGFLDFSRAQPSEKTDAEYLKWARHAAIVVFNPLNTLHLMEILALNGEEQEAKQWVKKMKAVLPSTIYQDMANDWSEDALKHKKLLSVEW